MVVNMELFLRRKPSSQESTIGRLYIGDTFECFILEDVIREIIGEPVEKWKVYGKTAIPAGRYEIIIDMSDRFKVLMMKLLNVPGFTGVRIHSGNKAIHTDGCLITGSSFGKDVVYESKKALQALFDKVNSALISGNRVFINISNP